MGPAISFHPPMKRKDDKALWFDHDRLKTCKGWPVEATPRMVVQQFMVSSIIGMSHWANSHRKY